MSTVEITLKTVHCAMYVKGQAVHCTQSITANQGVHCARSHAQIYIYRCHRKFLQKLVI